MIRKNRKSSGLTRIHDAVIHVFQRKALPYSYYTLQSNLRRLIRTDTGPIIYDFFKDQLLKKGMVILRESLKSLKGAALLDKLSETWDYFFKEILLTLQAILYPFQDCPPEDVTISLRQLILADFRDTVLLKINLDVEEALEMAPVVPEPIKQMVLVLQGINDGISLEHQLKLERIVVRAVYPYLGVRGLYESGDTEPTIEASTAANISAKETEASKILLNALVHGR
ncbi:PRR5 [Acanthosepion pharaonis]|uniref:PRR5 n=1 Tax=Acanthosepion pharaonis TaxID=158019 RepID=A0A812E126_ACAPH|nr:PRR5 [Sepia pharaonis]